MFQKLDEVEKRYDEITKKISDPEVIAQQSQWQTFMKEHAEIEPVVLKYREYKKAKQAIEDAKEMLKDPEMKELAEIEIEENKEKLPKLEEEIKILLIPKDPNDDKNVICEIRGGAGGVHQPAGQQEEPRRPQHGAGAGQKHVQPCEGTGEPRGCQHGGH